MAGNQADLEEGRMPFLEHLRELRDRLRNATIAFLLAFIVCWIFSADIYEWLRQPIDAAWMQHKATLGEKPQMFFQSPITPFWLYISVALWAGIFASSPFVFHQLWQFIAPGLYKRERRMGIVFAIGSAVCFVSGALFCYHLALQPLYDFFLGYADAKRVPMLTLTDYLDFTRTMMLAFGAVFELPILILFLSLIGMVTHRGMWKFNRWFIVIAFVVGAVLTPSPDAGSQLMMALPMIALYNMSILIAYIVTKRREARAAAIDRGEDPDGRRER
jgi:sec-independent protein translocase protein TatC